MKPSYRVIHQRKSFFEAILSGRGYTDWYIAQHRSWFGWQRLGVFATVAEAEACCADHAEGRLLREGTRIVSEFSERDE